MLVLALLYFLALTASASAQPEAQTTAQDQAQITAQLKDIRGKMGSEEAKLKAVEQEKKKIEESVASINLELESTTTQKNALNQNVQEIGEEIQLLQVALDRTKKEISDQRERLRKRVVAIYKMHHRTAAIDYIFHADSATDMLKRAHYLTIVAKSDRAQLDQLTSLLHAMEGDQETLSQAKLEKSAALGEVSVLEKILFEQQEKKASLLREAEQKANEHREVRNKLAQSADRLEAVLAKIMGSSEPIAPPQIAPEQGKGSESVVVKSVPGETDNGSGVFDRIPFTGSGLASVKGRLPLPVKGELLQGFGKHRHDDFSDLLFSKGWEFSSPVGAKVTPVAPGKVVFNQVLPGFGNVVIVDHGRRYYSLYGRLASSLCRVNDTVKPGDSIAVLGELDEKGRNFYFELRLEGKAIDPGVYFQSRPSTVSKPG